MTDYERKQEALAKDNRCKNCKYCRDVYTSPPQVKIRGCYCEPYKGKWVSEIEECPMQKGGKE